MKLDHTRHAGIFNMKDTSVVLIGAGGIGAITAITLGKMGVAYLEVWDGDVVEQVNLATQFFPASALGYDKSTMISVDIQKYAPGVINYPMGMIEPDDYLVSQIIISALDSIDTRKMLWNDVLFDDRSKWSWYLDARMGAEEFMLYTVKRDDADWYDLHLEKWSDDMIPDLPCTEKATIYTANGAAAFIGAAVRNIVTGEPTPKITAVNFKEGSIYHV